MALRKRQNNSLVNSFRNTFRSEWGVLLAIAILFGTAFIMSEQLSTWLKNSAFIEVLDALSKLSILIAVATFLWEIPKWEEKALEEAKQRQFEYWKAIDSAMSSREVSPDGRFTSYALRIALKKLASEQDRSGKRLQIRNVDFTGADLREIILDGANLSISQFRYSNLSKASFRKAELCTCTFASEVDPNA